MRSDAQFVARQQDRLDDAWFECPGRMMRAGGPILESVLALVTRAANPLRRGLAGYPGGFRRPGDRPALRLDPVHQQLSTEHCQFRPTMCHESLRLAWDPNTPNRVARLSFVNNVFVNHS